MNGWVTIVAILIVLLLAYLSPIFSKLDICDPPSEVFDEPLGKTSVSTAIPSRPNSPGEGVFFETKDVNAVSLGGPGEPVLDHVLISLGDPRKVKPSHIYWRGGRFELQIWFYIHNQTFRAIWLRDIKAHVYHVSMYRGRPMALPWAPRVELAMDNTADLRSVSRKLMASQAQPIHLVFETSIFDTASTILVFGIFVLYSETDAEGAMLTVPSDSIFVFQHDRRWKSERCHFVSTDLEAINRDEAQTVLQKQFFKGLKRIFHIHQAHNTGQTYSS
jgi:hypothetical protein